MEGKLIQIKEAALKELEAIKNSEELKNFQDKYFNKKDGVLTSMFKDLKSVTEDLRPKMGAMLNDVRSQVESAVGEKIHLVCESIGSSSNDSLDPTITQRHYHLGHLHPMTQMITDIEENFSQMGFWILRGPELESDFYNFEALNIPSWHPAREAQDTFYVESPEGEKRVLRTHTSSVQVRAMQKYGAPLRAIMPGRVYRNESTDASHEHTFYQFECLVIDENISIANLIATLKEMVSAIYKKEMKVRLRPGYFPFVEPGFELDMSCSFCDSKGCSICKHTGWIEMGGSGMVHPNVLKAGGIDPKKYSGFAFGMGLTRLLMMKSGIDEIRLMQSGDLRFLNQF